MAVKLKSGKKYIFIVSSLLILSFIIYNLLFNIYEIVIKKEPEIIFADTYSQIKIIIQPVNSLGWEIPFRKAGGKFKIIEGRNLITVIFKDEKKGILILKSTGVPGRIEIIVDSEYSLLSSLIKINILPKIV